MGPDHEVELMFAHRTDYFIGMVCAVLLVGLLTLLAMGVI